MEPSVPLNDGTHIPWLVYGTGTALRDKEVSEQVYNAIKTGYRHIDCALIYKNQHEVCSLPVFHRNLARSRGVLQVGAALKKVIPSVVKREELFITSKLWNNSHAPEDVEPALDECLKQLGLNYLDLFCKAYLALISFLTLISTCSK